MRTRDKLVLLGSLYAAQGLPFGFFTQTVPVVLREQGASLALVGAASALATPWGLKFLWARAIDAHAEREGGRRKVIVAMQALGVILLLALALGGAGISPLGLGLILLVNFAAATQDVATDGLAVTLLSPSERGLGNGVQVAAYRAGMILGGGLLLAAIPRLGLRGVELVLAALLALTTLPLLVLREPPPSPASRAPRFDLRGRLADPELRRFVIVLATYKFGEALATGMLRPFLVDRGLGFGAIGLLLGTVGAGAGLLGSLAGGLLVNRLGRMRSLVLFGLAQSLAIGLEALLAREGAWTEALGLAIGLEHLCAGMATTALFTAMMDRCRPGLEGTDYTVLASIVVVASGSASFVSGLVAERLGYPAHFALAALLSALALPPLLRGRAPLPSLEAP